MNTLLTPSEVAEHLRIKIPTLYSWTSQRRIPFVKLGSLIRFCPDDLSRWVAEQFRSPLLGGAANESPNVEREEEE